MDQTNGLITEEQKQDFLAELGLENLPEERKQELLNQMVDAVMMRIFNRISSVLTDDDITLMEDMDQKDQSGTAVNNFLISRVPNLDGIVREEITNFQNEMKDTLKVVDQAIEE